MTNLLSRPAPILARTVTTLSTISGGRFALGLGAGGSWEEIVALGVPRLSPGARTRALEEAITLVRALSGGGDPVTFNGEYYQVEALTPATAPAPPIWVGALGPKTLAVTGRRADGWIPGHLADWRSSEVASSRPLVDEAATAAAGHPGRDRDHLQRLRPHPAKPPAAAPATRKDAGPAAESPNGSRN